MRYKFLLTKIIRKTSKNFVKPIFSSSWCVKLSVFSFIFSSLWFLHFLCLKPFLCIRFWPMLSEKMVWCPNLEIFSWAGELESSFWLFLVHLNMILMQENISKYLFILVLGFFPNFYFSHFGLFVCCIPKLHSFLDFSILCYFIGFFCI